MWGVFPLYFRTLTHVSPWVILEHRILWSAGNLPCPRHLDPARMVLRSARHARAGQSAHARGWRGADCRELAGVRVCGRLWACARSQPRLLHQSVVLGRARHGFYARTSAPLARGGCRHRRHGRRKPHLPRRARLMDRTVARRFIWAVRTGPEKSEHQLAARAARGNARFAAGRPHRVGFVSVAPTNSWHSRAALLGVITATPLLFFGAALRRLPLSTTGFLQYVGPTLQFLVAIFALREPLDHAKLVSFGLCRAGIAVYVVDSGRTHTAQPVADRPE